MTNRILSALSIFALGSMKRISLVLTTAFTIGLTAGCAHGQQTVTPPQYTATIPTHYASGSEFRIYGIN